MRAAFFILIALALSASLAVAEDASPKGPQEERGTFKNKRGMVIATREWRSYEDEVGAEGKPISAVLVMLHGLGWHSGYFGPAAKTIVEAGFAVSAMDLQGHGMSKSASNEPRGYTAKLSNHVDDIEQFVKEALADERIMTDNDKLPLFIYAEGDGAMLALEIERRGTFKNSLSGLILSGPIFRPKPDAPKPEAGGFFSRVDPLKEVDDKRTLAESMASLSAEFGDEKVAQRAKMDELIIRSAPRVGHVHEVAKLGEKLWKSLEKIRAPLLILHGDSDETVTSADSEEVKRRAGSSDKTILLLDGMKHKLLHDEDYLTFGVVNRIIGWMGQRSVTDAAE